jgi:DNA helicase-2/ATP-dependent DNA helicase PcrA
MDLFAASYGKLNTEQKRAVDTIDGPVMVIAGPGTGKTQVLTLRIANIRKQTDTAADSILCLTFTNAGVKAMRERLLEYMGAEATKVKISTFHSFALSLIEEFYTALDFDAVPQLLDTAGTVVLYDELLHVRQWQYLRPRTNSTMFVKDIQSTFSALKRDGIAPEAFRQSIEQDIAFMQNDPANISSRGESKGQLKKEAEKKLDSLERTLELADFYKEYELLKKERNVIDYNDVLELLVTLVHESEEARASIREKYLYVLVDEHQDSSGIQNKFLERVWANQETKNVFVVGDDRQLIYGFGGASLSHFERFIKAFGDVTRITLVQNYRSTQTILDTADQLLQSTLAEGKLISNRKESYPLQLVAADYARDEILAAGLDIRQKISEGIDVDDCAILVPKNRQVKSAIQVLKDMGLPVAAAASLRLFEVADTQAFLTILRSIVNPFDTISLSRTILDPLSGIGPLSGHAFLAQADMRTLSVQTLLGAQDKEIVAWGTNLNEWLERAQSADAYSMVQVVGEHCLLNNAKDDEQLRQRVEIIRTLLHVALAQAERGTRVDLKSYLEFIDRLQEYDEDISLAVFGADKGIKVLTLHGSKGLEFDAVWIAHMDERSFNAKKRQAFTLPATLEKEVEAEDELVKKRELYVAITRAKRFCTISYSRHGYTGADQQVAQIIAALPEGTFEEKTVSETEESILKVEQKLFVASTQAPVSYDVRELVKEHYKEHNVSVTLLNNFFECTWKWYFRNILQLPEQQNNSLHVGNIVHKNIDYVLKAATMPTVQEIEQKVLAAAECEARYDERLTAQLVAESLPIVLGWRERYAPTIATPFSTERPLTYRDDAYPGLTMFGKIDLIEDVGAGTARVTDWKTGSVKTSTDIEKRDEEGRMSGMLRQLAMYSFLLNGAGTSVAESRLVFLEATKGDKHAVHARHITDTELSLLRQDIADYMVLVASGEWVGRKCNTKLYGEGDSCPYCGMAKRFGLKTEGN